MVSKASEKERSDAAISKAIRERDAVRCFSIPYKDTNLLKGCGYGKRGVGQERIQKDGEERSENSEEEEVCV